MVPNDELNFKWLSEVPKHTITLKYDTIEILKPYTEVFILVISIDICPKAFKTWH